MKLLKMAAVVLVSATSLFACMKGQDQDSSSNSAQAVSRKTLDGAYMKIYGGKQSYFVFHTAAQGEKKNSFFAEFESDGDMIRAEGIFTYGHDNLGNYVDLMRADGSQTDYSSSSSGGGQPADDAGGSADDAGSSDDSGGGGGDPNADAAPSGSAPPSSSDPTAPIYQRFHFVKTGVHDTILTRDGRDRTYQFKMVSSYCGQGGAKDCVLQKGANACPSKWTCTEKHTCSCGSN